MNSDSNPLEKRIKRQIHGKSHRFVAIAPLGFEELLVQELENIKIEGAEFKVISDGKVEFSAKLAEAWKAVAYSRIANRVLMDVGSFNATNFGQLEKKLAEIPWELYLYNSQFTIQNSKLDCGKKSSNAECRMRNAELDCGKTSSNSQFKIQNSKLDCGKTSSNSQFKIQNSKLNGTDKNNCVENSSTFRIHVACKHSRLYHSDAIAERVHPIIQKRLQEFGIEDWGDEYSTANPQNLYINFVDDHCTLWLDLAGEELYKRGHKHFVAEAPLKETIAAAMIYEGLQNFSGTNLQASSTDGAFSDSTACTITIVDPMAGSGTFSLEAAYMAYGLIPGECRDFALMHQPGFKDATWKHICSQFKIQNSKCTINNLKKEQHKFRILTSDCSERAVSIICHNVKHCPLTKIAPEAIKPQVKDFFSYNFDEIASGYSGMVLILLNPPYGKRLNFDAPALYTKIGRFLSKFLGKERRGQTEGIHVAILAPKGECRENLLRECALLNPAKNDAAKEIKTCHGGISLSALFC